ncbi:MAG: glycoside hydrolase family 2 protein [Bacteroidales bacterium]|jgi:beta-mannosidase|nr:glycoside hydrolase family 2 protein [Bacteroidales bacterium]
MKIKSWIFILCLFGQSIVIAFGQSGHLSTFLHQNWQFKQVRVGNWYPAKVPGVVHLDLMREQLIENPFFRLNERAVQWIDKEDWVYETTFSVDQNMLKQKHIKIVFHGLDTYAEVFLNDEKIVDANNMFRIWEANIGEGKLKPTNNTLRVYFHSPIKIDYPKWSALPFHYPADNDQSENGGLLDMKLSVFARKAGYHYGWDWGPRLVTCGIWRPVELVAWSDALIEDVQIVQDSVSARRATGKAIVEIISDRELPNFTIAIENTGQTANDKGEKIATATVTLLPGLNKITLPYKVNNPKLWWTNGLGTPHLYRWRVTLQQDEKTVDIGKEMLVGLRSLKLVKKPDTSGETFYFELNGVPIFAKGANYIPCDNFLPRVTPAIYEKTIADAKNANMNMLRVWGGGIYEDDLFYTLCDQNGILVWQDFMFACSMYPAEGEWLENVRQEAIDNVRRLRNHPCIALWCGNNECQDAWLGWGWKTSLEKQNPDYVKKVEHEFENQYYKVLPKVVADYGGGTPYTPSSPFAEKWKKSETQRGDCHYWGVWHAEDSIASYNIARSRFFSEYGFQSFPAFESVKLYAPENRDWNLTSDVMMAHQRGGSNANRRIENYLQKEYRDPKDFQHFLYLTQLMQGDAIKTAIEAHRRDMPYCMGSLFWQHNDCWPVASWSSRDYYGQWKAQHYFAREAYRNLLISPIEKNEKLYIYAVSDYLKNLSATLSVQLLTLEGTLVQKFNVKVKIPANKSTVIFNKEISQLLQGYSRADVVLHVTCRVPDSHTPELTSQNIYFFEKQKNINYPKPEIRWETTELSVGDTCEIKLTLHTKTFARGVYLSLEGVDYFMPDNYFNMLPGTSRELYIKTALNKVDFDKQLKITSITDAY